MKKLYLPKCPCCGDVCPVSLIIWIMQLPSDERERACQLLYRTALEDTDG